LDEWKLAPNNFQGVRVNCGGSDWFLMRMSLHDPVLVLNIECDEKEKLQFILNMVKKFLSSYKKVKLDLNNN
jgi:phosphomannomutase